MLLHVFDFRKEHLRHFVLKKRKYIKKMRRNLEDELAFLLPAVVDKNFRKAQIFCNSRHLSDLVGEV